MRRTITNRKPGIRSVAHVNVAQPVSIKGSGIRGRALSRCKVQNKAKEMDGRRQLRTRGLHGRQGRVVALS